MPSTIYSISEAILRRLKGGRPDAATGVDIREIKTAVVQNLNAMLKVGHYQGTMAGGETIPDGTMMATYLNVPVSTYQKNRATCLLPAIPIQLPMNMGLFEVRPSQKEIVDDSGYGEIVGNTDALIPMKAGDYNLALGSGLLNELGNFVGYWPVGSTVVFTKNLPLLDVDNVDIDMFVLDMSQIDDDMPLPIYPDYEEQCIETVFKKFMGNGFADPDIDNLTEKKTNSI